MNKGSPLNEFNFPLISYKNKYTKLNLHQQFYPRLLKLCQQSSQQSIPNPKTSSNTKNTISENSLTMKNKAGCDTLNHIINNKTTSLCCENIL